MMKEPSLYEFPLQETHVFSVLLITLSLTPNEFSCRKLGFRREE
jgi:hypothetical protein